MKKIVFVFTNHEKWNPFGGVNKTEIDEDLLQVYYILKYSKGELVPVEENEVLQDNEIFFVWDGGNDKQEAGLKQYEKIKKNLDKQAKFYTVAHTNGVNVIPKNKEKLDKQAKFFIVAHANGVIEYIVQSSHVYNTSHDKVRKNLNNGGDIANIVNSIIKEVFTTPQKLEAYLKFLHGCLDKQTMGDYLQASDFNCIADAGIDIYELKKHINQSITDAMIIDMREKLKAATINN